MRLVVNLIIPAHWSMEQEGREAKLQPFSTVPHSEFILDLVVNKDLYVCIYVFVWGCEWVLVEEVSSLITLWFRVGRHRQNDVLVQSPA